MAGIELLVGADFGLSLVLLGAVIAGSVLFKPKNRSAITDKEATTTSARGSFIPLIIGSERTGPAILWVGDREVRRESSGKGKGGLFGPPQQNVFYEAAWHGLCVGPGAILHRIWADGKLIWTGPISSGTHPDGTLINVPGEGDFEIYWGAETPAGPNLFLGAMSRVGLMSGWPLLMYVVWKPKKLGLAPRWPNLEYEVEVHPYSVSLAGGSMLIASSGGSLGADDGINPAHILEQLLMQPYPHGMGLSSALFDIPSLQSLSTLASSEHLAMRAVVRNGDDFVSAIAALMQDIGLFLPLVDGKVYFKPIRPAGTNYPVLYENVILAPRPEIDARIGDAKHNALQFVFSDRNRAYRPNTIGDANEAPDIYRDSRNIRKIDIASVCSLAVGAAISTRRAQEELSLDTKIRVIANHTARDIYPGMVIAVADIPYKLRVLSVKAAQLTQRVEIECTPDFFGEFTTWIPDLGGNSGVSAAPAFDNSVDFDSPPWQGPPWTPGGEPSPAVLAIIQARSSEQTIGSEIWISTDDITYVRIGLHDGSGVAGELDETLESDGAVYLDSGPLVTFDGLDLQLLQDLSTNLLDWSIGRQSVYVEGEILYVQWFEAVSGNQYRMRGVYRARRGFGRKPHAIGARLIVFNPDDIFFAADAIIGAAEQFYIKSQPYSWAGARDLSAITPVTKARSDLALQVPFGVENLRLIAVRGHYDYLLDSVDATFKWNYRNSVGQRSGAGFQLPGEAVSAMPPLGTFELELLLNDHTTVVHSVTGLTASSYMRSWANLELDLGPLTVGDTFYVRVREAALGRFSAWSEVQVLVVS